MPKKSSIDRAKSHIRRKTTEWYDFCSNIGQIPGNIAHMPLIWEAFAAYLEGDHA